MKTQSFITPLLHHPVTFHPVTFHLVTFHLVTFHLVTLLPCHLVTSFITILLLLSSCSPQRRLERLVAHHPELRIADTLLIRDTLIRPAIVADTSFPLSKMTDTVVISRDRLEIKLVRINDTIRIKGKCKADTIIRELRIPVEKIKLVKEGGGWLCKVSWIILGLFIIAAAWKWVTG